MKEIELKVISELMKNSRRSDRELAKAVGVSQPTVSRTIQKLEKKGIIKEYTMIPDFEKLGYDLLAMILIKYKENLDAASFAEEDRRGIERLRSEESAEVVMTERGIGLGYDVMVLAYEKDYSSYTRLLDKIRNYKNTEPTKIEGFIVNLKDNLHHRSFTYSTLAKHLLTNQNGP